MEAGDPALSNAVESPAPGLVVLIERHLYFFSSRGNMKRLEYKELSLPAPGDASVVKCPWCGEICDLEEAELDDYFEEVDSGFYIHRDCGKLVKILGEGD